MNTNLLANKCSGQSYYGCDGSYVTAQYCFSKVFLIDIMAFTTAKVGGYIFKIPLPYNFI